MSTNPTPVRLTPRRIVPEAEQSDWGIAPRSELSYRPPSRFWGAARTFALWTFYVARFLALSALATGAIWYFFGTTSINASLDGRHVKAQVFVDGDYAGDTPLKKLFAPGTHEVVIIQPDGSDTEQGEWDYTMMMFNLGASINAEFTTIHDQ